MDDTLQRRLDGIARRQRYLLLLLGYPYLVAGLWVVLRGTDGRAPLALVTPALVLLVGAYLTRLVSARRGTTETGAENGDIATE
jgi:hypothetical protein